MKLIVAYVQPFLVEKIVQTLHATDGVSGATVTHARGFGRGRRSDPATEEEVTGASPRVRIEVAANDESVNAIVADILDAAHTGKRGDGKVLVIPIERAIRIQTREEGPGVL